MKDENGNFFADFHTLLPMWRNHFSQVLNVHGVTDFRQTGTRTADPLMPEPNDFEFEMASAMLIGHKPQGIDQIPAESIKAGNRIIRLAGIAQSV